MADLTDLLALSDEELAAQMADFVRGEDKPKKSDGETLFTDPFAQNLWDKAAQLGSGINKGLANSVGSLLGSPFDAVEGASKLAGYPIDVPDQLQAAGYTNTAKALLPTERVPTTMSERMIDRVGQEVGANIPGLGASFGLGAAAAPTISTVADDAGNIIATAVPGAARALPDRVRTIAESLFRLSPEKIAKAQTALAVAAGGGAAVADEMFPDSATADLVGSLVGGVGAPAAYSIVKGIGRKMNTSLGIMNKDEVRAAAAKIMDEHIGDNYPMMLEGFDQRDKFRLDAPSYNPTTAEMSGIPSLGAAERARLSGGPEFNEFKTRYENVQHSNTEAFNDVLDQIRAVPKDGPTIANTQEALKTVLDERLAKAEEALRRAEIGTPANRGMTPDESGRFLRDYINNIEKDFKQGIAKKLFDKVDRGNQVHLDAYPLLDEVKRQVGGSPSFDPETGVLSVNGAADANKDIPQVARDLFKVTTDTSTIDPSKLNLKDAYGQPITPDMGDVYSDALAAAASGRNVKISFRDMRDLRSRVIDDLANAKSARGTESYRPKLVKHLTRLNNTLQDMLDSVGDNTEFPDVARDYRFANGIYKDAMDHLENEAASLVKRVTGRGDPSIADNQVGSIFFAQGRPGKSRAEQFRDAVAKMTLTPEGLAWQTSPEGQHALRDWAIDDLARRGDANGHLTLTNIERWRRDYRDALSMFPDIDKETSTMERAQRFLEDNAKTLRRSADEIEKGALGRFLGADPDRAVRTLVSGNRPAQNTAKLLSLVGDDDAARNGLRRSLVDYVQGKIATGKKTIGDADTMSPFKLRQVREELKGTFNVAWDEEHRRKLSVLQKMMEMSERGKRSRVSGADTYEKFSNLPKASKIKSFFWDLPGIPGAVKVGARLMRAGRSEMREAAAELNTQKIERIFQNALIDPEAADILYWHVRGAKPTTTIKRINLYLANRVPSAMQGLEDYYGEPGDPGEEDTTGQIANPTPTPTPRLSFTPVPPPPPTPAPPKPVKLPKPIDVSKDLKRGTITPTDVQDLARAGLP